MQQSGQEVDLDLLERLAALYPDLLDQESFCTPSKAVEEEAVVEARRGSEEPEPHDEVKVEEAVEIEEAEEEVIDLEDGAARGDEGMDRLIVEVAPVEAEEPKKPLVTAGPPKLLSPEEPLAGGKSATRLPEPTTRPVAAAPPPPSTQEPAAGDRPATKPPEPSTKPAAAAPPLPASQEPAAGGGSAAKQLPEPSSAPFAAAAPLPSQESKLPPDPSSMPAPVAPSATAAAPAAFSQDEQRPKEMSLDDTVAYLSKLQLMVAVPTLAQLREGRPLRRMPDELYAAQFVLQSCKKKLDRWLGSKEGQMEYHPHLAEESFDKLEDGTPVIYQTNGVARITVPLLSRTVKCDRTGAPGFYSESRMICARLRQGRGMAGVKGARTMTKWEDMENNLFYSFTSCQLLIACSAPVGEFGDEDTGERIFIRRSVKDFQQHWFHNFPIARQLVQLLDKENEAWIGSFSASPEGAAKDSSMSDYSCTSIRSWQTYEAEGKAPEEDAAARLVQAARIGHTRELEQLVLVQRLDCNAILYEFGLYGNAGRTTGFVTQASHAYAEERTALIAGVEAGWLSVVELIADLASQGKASINVVCREWTPKGCGGPGLREAYTALDLSRVYHRKEIEEVLLRAGAKSCKDLPMPANPNPFLIRKAQDSGEYDKANWEEPRNHKDRFTDFTFAEFTEAEMDPEMKEICEAITEEMARAPKDANEKSKHFKKLALRWHPDKHADQKKGLATRVFQFIQRLKDEEWEGKAWSA